MNHRKQTHASEIEPCHKFSKGECPFQDKFCWFKHETKVMESIEDNLINDNAEKHATMSDFQEVTKSAKPPIMSKTKSN